MSMLRTGQAGVREEPSVPRVPHLAMYDSMATRVGRSAWNEAVCGRVNGPTWNGKKAKANEFKT